MSSIGTRLHAILRCPSCSGRLDERDSLRVCEDCATEYPDERGVLRLLLSGGGASESAAFYNEADAQRYGRDEATMGSYLREPVLRFVNELPEDSVVVEVGSGRGAFDGCHPGYVALDLSCYALDAFSTGARVQADARALPFADRSVSAFFSIASLEHMPQPDSVLAEIDRCLAPGGRALLYPAWFVRPWAAKAIHLRPYGELLWRDRLVKLSIPLRNSRPYRFLSLAPARLRREYSLGSGRRVPFEFRSLSPNLDQYLASDSDAFASLDPHAVATFFLARGYRDLRRPTAVQRLGYASEPVLLEKVPPGAEASG